MSPALARFIRYATVGVSTLLIDLGLLYAVTEYGHVPYYIATPLTFLCAVSINYFLSRAHVFRGTERKIHHGYLCFIGMTLLGGGLTTLGVSLLVTALHLYYMFARVLVAGVIGSGNYLFNLYFNFKVAGKHS